MKYDVWFCKCGRIHLMNNDKYDWLAEDFQNRKIIRVCQNCGATRQTWLDEYFMEFMEDEENPRPSFTVCDSDVKEGEFIGDNTRLIFSRGIPVPLENGEIAEYFGHSGIWYYSEGSCKVWTKRLISDIRYHYKEDAEDILNSISGYAVGIDWGGTPYCR